VRAIFDTGSANTWILSKEAKEVISDGEKHQFFDKTLSGTYEESN